MGALPEAHAQPLVRDVHRAPEGGAEIEIGVLVRGSADDPVSESASVAAAPFREPAERIVEGEQGVAGAAPSAGVPSRTMPETYPATAVPQTLPAESPTLSVYSSSGGALSASSVAYWPK